MIWAKAQKVLTCPLGCHLLLWLGSCHGPSCEEPWCSLQNNERYVTVNPCHLRQNSDKTYSRGFCSLPLSALIERTLWLVRKKKKMEHWRSQYFSFSFFLASLEWQIKDWLLLLICLIVLIDHLKTWQLRTLTGAFELIQLRWYVLTALSRIPASHIHLIIMHIPNNENQHHPRK